MWCSPFFCRSDEHVLYRRPYSRYIGHEQWWWYIRFSDFLDYNGFPHCADAPSPVRLMYHLWKKGSFFFLTLDESRLYVTIFRVVSLASMIAFEVVWTCKCRLVFQIDIQFFFSPFPKLVLLWVLWVAVGGSAIGVSGLLSSCSRYAQLLTGACSALIYSTRSHLTFFKKKVRMFKGARSLRLSPYLDF